MNQKKTARSSIGTVTRSGQTLDQIHEAASALTGSVKNAEDAKTLLQTQGWIIASETVSLEILARTLFAVTFENKLAPKASNAILAAAFLLTERLEEGVKQDTANKIVKHLRETISALTAQEVSNTIAEQLREPIKTFTDEIQQRMDEHARTLEESAQKTITQTRSYSQMAASPPAPQPTTSAPALTHSQLQIRNREQIKKRQVLINFQRTEGLVLDVMNETTLSRKADDSLRTTWAATSSPKPNVVKLKMATLLRNGGLLLELNTPEAAQWLTSGEITEKFLEGIGSGTSIRNRSYQVIVHFVPIGFDPEDEEQVRTYEEHNNIPPGSVLKAEWIKPISERKKDQRVATLRVFHKDAESANSILREGAQIFNKRVEPKRPRKEPIRCLKCQRFGHERRDCRDDSPTCAKCAGSHDTNECKSPRENYNCANCHRSHASFNRDCAKFWEKCREMDQRCPENALAFYPTDEQWTWVIGDFSTNPHPPPPPPPRLPAPHPLAGNPQFMRQTTLTGTNGTPLAVNRQRNWQSQDHYSQ